MAFVHVRIQLREVGALVGAAALAAGQRGTRDQAHQRVGVVEQVPQPVGAALEPRVAPQRLA